MAHSASKIVYTTESGCALSNTMRRVQEDPLEVAQLRYNELRDLLYRVRETLSYVLVASREEHYSQTNLAFESLLDSEMRARLARLLVDLDNIREELGD